MPCSTDGQIGSSSCKKVCCFEYNFPNVLVTSYGYVCLRYDSSAVDATSGGHGQFDLAAFDDLEARITQKAILVGAQGSIFTPRVDNIHTR